MARGFVLIAGIGAGALFAAGAAVAAPRSTREPTIAEPAVIVTEPLAGPDTAPLDPIFTRSEAGAQTLDLGAPLGTSVLVDVTFEGADTDAFTVTGLAGDGTATSFAIFASGSGAGRYLLQGTEPVQFFDVQATGAWTLTIWPLAEARTWDGSGPISGTGNEVVGYTGGGGAVTFAITGDSESSITLVTYTPDGLNAGDFVASEFGVLTGGGALPPGPLLLDVGCADPWTLTVGPA